MYKTIKFRKLIGAIVAFVADTPQSESGEERQHVVLRVDHVYRAKSTKRIMVRGLAFKRLNEDNTAKVRQFAVERIYNRTLAIIQDNEWTKNRPSLRRLTAPKRLAN